jgi:response regulator RpfG family c-di-GMP phosphodiesterase
MDTDKNKAIILAVDDTEDNIDILVEMLGDKYDIAVAMDGPSALKAATVNRPNIILLDIMMPDMDGYEVCRRLKADRATQKIPIIFISAIDDTEGKVKAFELGGVDYVCKPFHPSEVKARVETQLELANSRDELEDALSQTLTGAVRMLSDILSMTHQELFGLSSLLSEGMRSQCRIHALKPIWVFELAGLLFPIGMLATSSELLRKMIDGRELDEADIKQLDTNAQLSVQLLARIPRLERTADVIRLSALKPHELMVGKSWNELDDYTRAGLILRILRESPAVSPDDFRDPNFIPTRLKNLFDLTIQSKSAEADAEFAIPGGSDDNTADAVQWGTGKPVYLKIPQLKEGFVLMEDIYNKSEGRKLAGKGFVLTRTTLLLLNKYLDRGELDSKSYSVRVPKG